MFNGKPVAESVEVYRVDPPRIYVDERGLIIKTIAEFEDANHERIDLGVVATRPTLFDTEVRAFIGKGVVFNERHDTNDVGNSCIVDAEELAEAMIFARLAQLGLVG